MLGWLFGKSRRVEAQAAPAPFEYGDSLRLEWSADSESWVAPLAELGPQAQICISPAEGADPPQAASCELMLRARARIVELDARARAYLVANRPQAASSDFTSCGLEIFEHEKTPGEYSLLFDPSFDPGAVWRVRFEQDTPISWGYDD